MKIKIIKLLAAGLIMFCMANVNAAGPERVLIIGDSMMRVTAHATTLALDKHAGVTTKSQTSLGSGLARLDAYDWIAKVDELVKEFNPDMTVAWFGTNDRQAMQTETGIINAEDPGWEAEYARRIGVIMDKLTAAKGARVYWLELPVMREKGVNDFVEIINRIAKSEADKRASVTFFATRGILGRKPDAYSPNVIGPTGKMIVLRDSDGVHLSRPGADRIAEALDKEFYK